MRVIIPRVCLTRVGVNKFATDVNTAIANGYDVAPSTSDRITIEKKGLRFLCFAQLSKPSATH